MASEKIFENKIKKYLKNEGAWGLKYWAGARFTKAGIPDLLYCVAGKFVAIEVKGQNGAPSELQLHTCKEINKAGGFAFVLYPSAFDKFKKFIQDLKFGYYNRENPLIWK